MVFNILDLSKKMSLSWLTKVKMYYVCHGCLIEAHCMEEQMVELNKWLRTLLVCHVHTYTTYEYLLFLSAQMSEDSSYRVSTKSALQ